MEELLKRIKGGLWVALAGFIITVIGLVLENISVLNLGETEKVVVMILGTALISQITKYLNK